MRQFDRGRTALRRGGIARQLVTWSVLATVVAAATGCHNVPVGAGGGDPSPRQRGRLPVLPGEATTPPGPALLDTIEPWKQPKLTYADWQIAFARLPGTDLRVSYRAPQSWAVDSRGRGKSGDGLVQSSAVLTNLHSDDFSLATYAAQLAEDSPIYSLTTEAGYPIYLMSRRISVAPTDPNAQRFWYHTAIVEVDDRIAKLEVRYGAANDWRFHDVGRTMIGTIDVRPRYGR